MGSVQESGLKCPICGKNRLLSDYYAALIEGYERKDNHEGNK